MNEYLCSYVIQLSLASVWTPREVYSFVGRLIIMYPMIQEFDIPRQVGWNSFVGDWPSTPIEE